MQRLYAAIYFILIGYGARRRLYAAIWRGKLAATIVN
jgi:hypothetical protein